MKQLFKISPLIKKSFFQRLFKQEPIDNAIIEFNNLLAKQDILSITETQLNNIEIKYGVILNREFDLNLQEFYAVYWNAYIKSNEDDIGTESELQHLVKLFKLDNQIVSFLQIKIGETWYKQAVSSVANKHLITKEDKYKLERLRQRLKLSEEIADKLLEDAKAIIVNESVAVIIKSNRCSPENEITINSLFNDLEISAVIVKDVKNKLSPLKYYWELEHLPLKAVQPRIALQKSEICFLQIDRVKWYETRNDRQGYKHYELVNQGSVYLTNKRLVFDGSSKNSIIPYDRIRSIANQTKGTIIYKDKGKDPILDLAGSNYEFEIILNRVLREFKGFELR